VVNHWGGVSRSEAQMKVMFQNHALQPWLIICQNVRVAADKVVPGVCARAMGLLYERHSFVDAA
jgi:ABC-type nitrate/sulfonate/bicarbonate transport system ATPase subunit